MNVRVLAVALLLLAAPAAVSAQTAEPARMPGYTVERHTLESAELGEEREIWVGLPPGYASGAERYQVLYVLDADGLFQPATAYAYYLPLGGSMPRLLVVGVRSKSVQDRTLIFTPPGGTPARPGTGGADRFLAFLTKEVRPFVERTYRTHPFATLAGHSMAGLFAVYALSTAPQSFDAYFAFSPTLAYNGGVAVAPFERYIAAARPTAKHLYLSAANEPQFPQEATQRVVRMLEERAGPTLRWKYARFDAEDHFTTVPPAMWDAIRWLYGGWAVADYAAATPESLDAHYKALSAKFGYAIPLPESALNLHGYTLLSRKRTKDAVRAFVVYTERFPKSPDAWDGLADAYEADGQLEEAKRAVDTAVRLATDSGADPRVYAEHRDRVDALLKKGSAP